RAPKVRFPSARRQTSPSASREAAAGVASSTGTRTATVKAVGRRCARPAVQVQGSRRGSVDRVRVPDRGRAALPATVLARVSVQPAIVPASLVASEAAAGPVLEGRVKAAAVADASAAG